MKLVRLLLLFTFLLSSKQLVFSQNIVVNDTYTAQQLVQDVLINSPCATVSNFIVSGDSFSGAQNSYGYFNANGSSFPFAEGVVLSTAKAKRSEGPNNNLIDEGDINWLGDSDLQQILNIGNTFNATSLEFDFVPLTSSISFDFLFASEEYQGTAPCTYSDGFGFLLKPANSSVPYQNLALIPGTTTPVLVTTVHPRIGNTCDAINEEFFGGYNNSSAPINFNGQTKIMTASATVIPGTTYHIKLVIADEGNIRYDSAIFLGAGSFNIGVNLGTPKLIATNNPLCIGETLTLDATVAGAMQYKWFKNNVLQPQTTPTFVVSDSGTYSVEVEINATCIAKDEIIIEYAPALVLNNTTLIQCDDNADGITTFDLTKTTSIITSSDPNLSLVNFYENLSNAQNNISEITNPQTFQNLTTNSVIAKIKNQFGCFGYATITLQISNNSITPISPEFCDSDAIQDGIMSFLQSDFDAITSTLTTGLPTGLVASYYLNSNEALQGINPITVPFQNTTANSQIIYAKLLNGSDCYGLVPITLIINTFSPPDFDDELVGICSGVPKTISVANGFSSYLWTTGETSNQITVSTANTYSVEVSDNKGCKATKNFIVEASEPATITSFTIDEFNESSNSVLINYTGIGDYVFSLDGIHFQTSNYFTNVAPGEYNVVVKDLKECGETLGNVFVLSYPAFFSPNGDGFNDVWRIKNINQRGFSVCKIFDRYGKLLKQFTPNSSGWNGKLNNTELPADDYWFVLTLESGREIKGHFSLVR